MTISDYTNLPTITIPYILRDIDNQSIGVWVTNQETKEKLFCDSVTIGNITAIFYQDYFTIDITDIIAGVNENTTLSVSAIDSSNLPIYRDIVAFSQRLDVIADYEQNNTENEYTFVQ